MVVWWLEIHTTIAKGMGLIPGLGTKIPQAAWPQKKKKKKKKESTSTPYHHNPWNCTKGILDCKFLQLFGKSKTVSPLWT